MGKFVIVICQKFSSVKCFCYIILVTVEGDRELLNVYLTSTAEIDNADQCFDDIIGQSLMLAHNAVQSSPEQLLTSHVHCQGLLDGPPPVCDPVDDVCIKSCDQHGLCDQNGSCDQKGLCDQHRSHDQLMNSCEVICLDSNDVANTICSTHEVTKPSSTATVATVATNMPSKMSFIDWTKIKRKNVTPADYPSTPTPVYVTLDQGSRNPVVNPVVSSNKKKRTNTNTTTVSFHKYLLFAVRVCIICSL